MKRYALDRGDLILIIYSILGAGNYAAVKIAMFQMPIFAIAAFRFIFGGALLMLLTYLVEGNLYLPRKLWTKVILLGAIGIFAYQILFTQGLAITTSVNTALIISLSPFFTTLFLWIFKSEKVSYPVITGIFIGFIGVLMISLGKKGGLAISFNTVPGDLLILLAAMLWSFYGLMSQEILKVVSSLKMTTYAILVGAILLLPFGILDLPKVAWSQLTISTWCSLAFSTLIATCLVFILWALGLTRVGISRAMIYMYLQPFVALILGIWLLDESVSWLQLIGGIAIIFSIITVHRFSSQNDIEKGENVEQRNHCQR